MIANAFTCTGPYALLIRLGIKRVENRGAAPEPRTGRCAISCSKSFCKEEYGNFVQWASQTLSEEDFDLIPTWSDVKDWPGKIVVACSYSTRSRDDLVLESASYLHGRRPRALRRARITEGVKRREALHAELTAQKLLAQAEETAQDVIPTSSFRQSSVFLRMKCG